MPAAHQRSAICPSRQRLTLRGVVAADRDHRLDGVGRPQRPGQGGWHVEAEHGQGLGHALAQAAGGAGVGLVQLRGQRLEQRLGFERGVGVVGGPHPLSDRAAHLLGQVVTDVPDLVELAAGDHRVVEHLLDRRGERLGAVQDGQDRLGDVQAALAQPDQQAPDQGGVLRRSLDQREGMLGAVDVDARARPRTGGRRSGPRRSSAPPGPARTGPRRAGRPARSRSSPRTCATPPTCWSTSPSSSTACADRLQRDRVAAGRDPGQHPLHRHPARAARWR